MLWIAMSKLMWSANSLYIPLILKLMIVPITLLEPHSHVLTLSRPQPAFLQTGVILGDCRPGL